LRRYGFLVAVGVVTLAACGGGGSTPPPANQAAPTPTPVATATAAPTATPTPAPGAVSLAYTSTFGASSPATTAPAALAFQAETQTASLTATEPNYTGSFAASSSCAAVTVSPASAANGQFTLTAVSAASSGCTITVTGATGHSATLAATVPAPGGVQLRWVGPGYQNLPAPVGLLAGPINIVGTGSLFAATLVATETAYLGGYTTPVASAGCGGNLAITAATPIIPPLPTTPPGASFSYYTVTASAAIASSANCTISTGDSATPPSTNDIGVVVTTSGGSIQ